MRTKARTIYLSIAVLLLSTSSSLAGQTAEKMPEDKFIGVFISDMPIEKVTADEWIENNRTTLVKVKQRIWELAELSFEEYKSSKILSDLLAEHGFEIESGVADMPTAFVASYGSGRPIIGILAEYDALPGVSQKAVPRKEAREDAVNGHACGHCLFGTASTAAAIAARYSMEKYGLKAHPAVRVSGGRTRGWEDLYVQRGSFRRL